MAEWKNFDQLAAYGKLMNAAKVSVKDVMAGENGAKRVREYQVPMLTIGRWKIGATGIRALSEIGAHAFARTYYEFIVQEENTHEGTSV